MKLALSLALAAAAAGAQTPDSIARQRAAIERQRTAVRRQVRSESAPTEAFFTVPWNEPLSQPPIAPGAAATDAVDAGCDPIPEGQIAPMVREIAQRQGLTPDLLRAVIEKESSYLPCAVSSAGAEGLMQLMPDTSAGLAVQNPFDPRQNIDGGAKYLR